LSRSGLTAGLVSGVAFAGAAYVHAARTSGSPAERTLPAIGRMTRHVVAASMLIAIASTAAWAGADRIAARFAETDSMGGRMAVWRDTLRICRDFPLVGIGLNGFETVYPTYQTVRLDLHFSAAHNDYLQLAAEGGLLLGVPILITLGTFIVIVRRRFQESDDERAYCTGFAWGRSEGCSRSGCRSVPTSACRFRRMPRSSPRCA
jgi:O-antigen ligase